MWRVPCREGEPLDYWRGLNSIWSDGFVIVNVEHDLTVDDDMVQSLLDCEHDQCTWAHSLFWPTTRKPTPQFAQRHNAPQGCKRESLYLGQPIEAGQEWCEFTAIGFCKIHPDARVRDLVECPWGHVDMAVTTATVGPWHVHWPECEHTHW